MKTAKQYNEMTQQAAYKIVQALSIFDKEPENVRHQAEQIIMQRVQLMRNGDKTIIDGDHLIKEVVEPVPTAEQEKPEADAPAP